MKIASWNVNSLNVRLPHLDEWAKLAAPDVIALQETKVEDLNFPLDAILAMGYQCVFSGQKTYNGVAILAKSELHDVETDVPGLDDPARRVLAATVDGVRIINLYVVNGQAVGSEKYQHKLHWLACVTEFIRAELTRHPKLVVLGDFNIAPEDRDVHDPIEWRDQILCSKPERDAFQALLDLGLHDSFRLIENADGQFSWWDYRQAAFRRNLGLRIDMVLISSALQDRVKSAGIDKTPRAWERASDHTPVWVQLDLP